jgi:EAL domain-containing protein (putative c-di-GMP-specific phosphodiesterase class I)
VGLAHASGLTVVAEGIETDEQRQLVTADGCDYGQGYLFARPLSPDEVPDCVLIASQRPLGQHVPAARASG